MSGKRCPHHVRHGKFDGETQAITFSDLCGLRVKQIQEQTNPPKRVRGRARDTIGAKKPGPAPSNPECEHYPFSHDFDYFQCPIYQEAFESGSLKNCVIPTKDFQYSEQLAGKAVTDMELL